VPVPAGGDALRPHCQHARIRAAYTWPHPGPATRTARGTACCAVSGTQSTVTAVLPLSRPRSDATHSQSRASPPPDGGALWRCRRHKRGSCLRHSKK
jgi:hypothetical protein